MLLCIYFGSYLSVKSPTYPCSTTARLKNPYSKTAAWRLHHPLPGTKLCTLPTSGTSSFWQLRYWLLPAIYRQKYTLCETNRKHYKWPRKLGYFFAVFCKQIKLSATTSIPEIFGIQFVKVLKDKWQDLLQVDSLDFVAYFNAFRQMELTFVASISKKPLTACKLKQSVKNYVTWSHNKITFVTASWVLFSQTGISWRQTSKIKSWRMWNSWCNCL